MQLSTVPEIGPSFAAKLEQAGIADVEMLAGYDDIPLLAETTGISADRLESFRDAARERLERALAEAGVGDPADLAEADVDRLAERTGLSRETLTRYQGAAKAAVQRALENAGYRDDRALAAMELEDAIMKTNIAAPHLARIRDDARARLDSRASWKVVLSEAAPVARVHLREPVESVALLTARVDEDDASALARTATDAVLLRPTFDVATVRVGGEVHRDLPLYRLRRSPGADEPQEVRVRVADVRDVPASQQPPPPGEKKGFRLFGRGKRSS